MNLFFYDVSVDYVNFLKQKEIEKRGFTRVPDICYQNEKKMVCGVVLEINSKKYYVPVSSYKIQQKNNILIKLEDDAFNQVKGSLRFNFMFPVPDFCIMRRNFASSVTNSRKEFLRRQWVYCNTIESNILQMAQDTYNDVTNGNDSSLKNASCDFLLLESVMDEYIIKNQQS